MKIKDWAGRLIWATMLVTIVRYMGAFAAADIGKVTGALSETLTIFLALSGAGMGFLDVLGGGLLFNGWRTVMPRAGQHWTFRFWVLTICVFMLLASGSIILVPFTVSRMTQSSIVDTLGGAQSNFTWLWAWMVVLVPYFIIIGVFVGNKMVEGLEPAAATPAISGNFRQVSGGFPADSAATLGKIRWEELLAEQIAELPHLTDSEIIASYGGSVRRARMWRQWAREQTREEPHHDD